MALREKHNLKHKDKTFKINVGHVVMIKGEVKNLEHWKVGNVKHPHIGKGNIIRVGTQLRIGKRLIDRPVQLLYPLELHCEGITTSNGDEKKNKLNPSATEFHPKRTAAEIEKWQLNDTGSEEDNGDI